MYKTLLIILALSMAALTAQAQTIYLELDNQSSGQWQAAFDDGNGNNLAITIPAGGSFANLYTNVQFPVTWSSQAVLYRLLELQ